MRSSTDPAATSGDHPPPFMTENDLEALRERLENDAPVADMEVAPFEDFASYGPIISLAVVPALVLALLLTVGLHAIGAPSWAHAVIGIIYVTLPLIAFLRWVWNKPAVRLRSGEVLNRSAARRYALMMWLAAAAFFLMWWLDGQ